MNIILLSGGSGKRLWPQIGIKRQPATAQQPDRITGRAAGKRGKAGRVIGAVPGLREGARQIVRPKCCATQFAAA